MADDPFPDAFVQFCVDGDERIIESNLYEWRGELWLPAGWHELPVTGRRVPARLIPLRSLDHRVLLNGTYWVATKVPRELADGDCPSSLRDAWSTVDPPMPVEIPAPKGTQ